MRARAPQFQLRFADGLHGADNDAMKDGWNAMQTPEPAVSLASELVSASPAHPLQRPASLIAADVGDLITENLRRLAIDEELRRKVNQLLV